MSNQYAENFFDILNVLDANRNLQQEVITLNKNKPILGKSLEDNNGKRLEIFRDILTDLVNGVIGLTEAYQRTEDELPLTYHLIVPIIGSFLKDGQNDW